MTTKTMSRFLFIQISGNIEVLLSEGGHRRVGSISRRRWCIERGHVPSTSHLISTDRAKSVSAVRCDSSDGVIRVWCDSM